MSRADSRPHPHILWTDPEVQALPLSQKRVLDYCWTGPDVNGAGITRVEPGVWQARVGEIGVAIMTCLQILEKMDLIVFDKKTSEVLVLGWYRFHKFDGPVGIRSFQSGIRQTESKMLRRIAEERFQLSGHKLPVKKIARPVDKLDDSQQNQQLCATTPTSTTTSTPPPPPEETGGEENHGGGESEIPKPETPTPSSSEATAAAFLAALGKPAAGIEPLLPGGNRHRDLCRLLATASVEQATAAGKELSSRLHRGDVKNPVAYAIGIAKRARDGVVTTSAAVVQAEADSEAELLNQIRTQIAGGWVKNIRTGLVFYIHQSATVALRGGPAGPMTPVDKSFVIAVRDGRLIPIPPPISS